MGSSQGRRTFLRGAAAVLATAASARSVLGANERLGIGFIGFGLIGKRHVVSFKEQPDVNLVAVAEAHKGRLDEAKTFIGDRVQGYRDFRQMLDNREVDAVVIATPDHWHALMTMLACAAGKDVYVEKPVTLFPAEGRWMLDIARKHRRIVQVGTQQRSGPHYQKARELIRAGHIGQVVSVRMQSFRNITPGFGGKPDGEPPPELDWEMFQGPAPLRKYNPNRAIYHFRWFWDYSGGQMTNLGQHSLDFVDWVLGPLAPRTVTSIGGRLVLRDNGETPDVQDALFDFGTWTGVWSHREVSRGQTAGSGLEFFGTKGSLAISRSGFTVTPDRKITPSSAIPQFTGAHPVGGPPIVKDEGPPQLWTEAVEDRTGDPRDQFVRHARNFLDCIRSRKTPASDLESGVRVSTLCHLANISLRLGRQVRWDAAKETILGDDEAVKMLERPYRAPWDEVRKKLLGG
jgi:predicted dehydrogenase